MKKIISNIFIVLPLLLTGCGGSDSNYTEVTSRSFSPIKAVDSNNESKELYWKYSVNGGQPISTVILDSSSVSLNIKNILIKIDKEGKSRVISGDGDFSGNANDTLVKGNVTFLNQENFKIHSDKLLFYFNCLC